MSDLLQEFCDSRGVTLRVDRTGGVIRGIKVLGLTSRNQREYLSEALARAVSLYDGAKVNVNHPKGHPLAPRDYQERIGIIRNVCHRAGEGLFADFHFNPKHYLSEQLIWDAEHAPENVGFSHNVQARTSRRGETTLVEEILRVHSVDLVADPATTRGLFESASAIPEDAPQEETNSVAIAADATEQLSSEQAAEIVRLQNEVDRLHAQEAAQQRRATVQSLLAEYRLPNPNSADAAAKAIVSDAFVQTLLSAPDEPTIRRMIEERSRLVGGAKQWSDQSKPRGHLPMSRDQTAFNPRSVRDAKSFARAITS